MTMQLASTPLTQKTVQREGSRGPLQRILDNTAFQPQLYQAHVNVGFNARDFQWEVNNIISKRTSDRSVEYLVNWVDWHENTWVAAADLHGSQRLIAIFEATFCLPNVVALAVSSDSDSSVSGSGSNLHPAIHPIPAVRVQVPIVSDDEHEQQQLLSDDDEHEQQQLVSDDDEHDEQQQQEPMCVDVFEEDYWEVENILLKRINHGITEYYVKWLDDINTWVAEADLNCPDLLRAFNLTLQ